MSTLLKSIQPQLPVQFEFTLEEVSKLMVMQDQLNTYIHPEWKTQGFNWDLAIIDECMEIHGHLGWKWWKPEYNVGVTKANLKQVQLEVIDILHFVLSDSLVEEFNEIAVAKAFNTTVYSLADVGHTVHAMIQGVGQAGISARMYWAILAHTVGLTKQQVMETYVQKFVLNKFRQDHGYKTGEYQKIWEVYDSEGKPVVWEDNQVLENIVRWRSESGCSTDEENALYSELCLQYNHRRNQ